MATIKYLLQSKSNNAPIYLRLSLGRGKTIYRKIGLFINSNDWSKSTGLPKQNNTTNKDLITDLRELETGIHKKVNQANKNGIKITGDWLLYNIDLNFNRINENEESNLLSDYIQKIIDNADVKILQGGKIGLSKSRVKGYITFKGVIEQYQKHINKEIDFKDIDINFEDDFRNWLIKSKGYSINYAGKNFDNLKAVCNEALRTGREVNNHANHIRSFTESKDDMEVITLSFDELDAIENLSDLSTSFENTRKWLLLGCEIGQRGGDLLSITEENFRTDEKGIEFIDVKQQKTGKTVTIPVREKVRQIKAAGLPYNISIQKFNIYVKDLCKLAGIDQMIMGKVYDNRKKRKVSKLYAKHQLITSHTCRRSFATNYYKQVPTSILRVITGHSKESLFLTYIGEKEDKDANAKLMIEYAEIMEQKRIEQKENDKVEKSAKLTIIKRSN